MKSSMKKTKKNLEAGYLQKESNNESICLWRSDWLIVTLYLYLNVYLYMSIYCVCIFLRFYQFYSPVQQ